MIKLVLIRTNFIHLRLYTVNQTKGGGIRVNVIRAILSILPSMIILLFVLGGAYYLDSKLNKMNDMWLSANQVTVKNQNEQIKINKAFGKQMDTFTNYIHALPQDERSQWLETYSLNVQEMLYTPPKGLKTQEDVK